MNKGKLVMQSAWAAALTSLIFVSSYWVPVLVIDKADGYCFTDTVSYIMFHAFVTIIYICFTFLAERYPRVLAHRNTVNVSLYLAVIGVVILFWSGYSTGQFTPLLTVLGSLLYLTGVYWLNIASCVSLSDMREIPFVVGVSFAFPVARLMTLLLSNLNVHLLMITSLILAVLIYSMARKSSRRVLDTAMQCDSPHNLKVTNIKSFLPFTSKLFVALLLTALLRMSLSTGQEATMQQAIPVFTYAAPLVIVSYVIIKHACPKADVLFLCSSFIMIFSVIIFLTFRQDPFYISLSFDLSGCGNGLAELGLYWYSIITLGSRNILATLPTLIWGRAALSMGSTLGAVLSASTENTVVAGVSGTTLCVACIALLFVGYNLIALKKFSFIDLANSIQPVSHPLPIDEQGAQNVSKTIVRQLADQYRLTPKEVEVLSLLARGRNYLFVEDALGIKRNTVKSHVRNIYGKLGIHSQQELIDLFDNRSQ